MSIHISIERETLQSALRQLHSLAADGPAEILSFIAAAEQRLSSPTFQLLVIGEYKRGKSTLINALLRKSVLPTSVIPLTSVITEVKAGREPSVSIEFDRGQTKDVALSELDDFVTEAKNPRNEKGARKAVITDDTPLLRQGVVIVDTPGVGSVWRHNSETTYRFLEAADAIVMVLAADQPFSSEERALLKTLRGVTNRVMFILNRIDTIRETDLEISLGFVHEQLKAEEFPEPITIIPLSARQAMDAAMQNTPLPDVFLKFETSLRSLLIEQKSVLLLERAQVLARHVIDLMLLQVQSQRHAAQLTPERLAGAVALMEREAGVIEEKLRTAQVLLRDALHQLSNDTLTSLIHAEQARLTDILQPKAAEMIASNTPNVSAAINAAANQVGQKVIAELEGFYRRSKEIIEKRLRMIAGEHHQRVSDMAEHLLTTANGELGMNGQLPRLEPRLPDERRFYFRDYDASGGIWIANRWLLRLPKHWSVPYARRQLAAVLDRRIGENLEAIRYSWITKLDDLGRFIETQGQEQVRTIVTMLRQGLDRGMVLRAATEVEHRRVDGELAERELLLRTMRDTLA